MSVTHAAPNGSLLWPIDEVENAVAPAVAGARLPVWASGAYIEFRQNSSTRRSHVRSALWRNGEVKCSLRL